MFDLVTQKYSSSDLPVISFRAVEQLSKPYSFDVLVAGRNLDAATLADDLLTERAHFHIARESDAPRVIHGVIRRVAVQGNWGGRDGVHTYRLRICPRMQLLARSQGTRIFQHLGVHDIVSRVLDEWQVKHRWTLVRTPAKRDYCVQYLESDLRFVSRILAEEGIFYWFEHPEGEDAQEVVVFGDTAHAIEPIEGNAQLQLRDSGGMAELEEDVRRFELLDRVGARGTLLKEFDFFRPSHDLRATSGPGSMFAGLVPFIPGMQALGIPALDGLLPDPPGIPGMDAAMGGAPSIPGVGSMGGIPGIPGAPDLPGLDDLSEVLGSLLPRRPYGGGDRRIYEHLGEADRLGVDPAMAERHLESHRANACVGEGESRCRRLRPGRSFWLHGAAVQAHDAGYGVVRVEHEGHHPEHTQTDAPRDVYRNTFWCVPHDVPPRPRRPKRRLQQVLETATVVGPPGEEIHTDEHGRIKVQFHWDLEGFYTQYSSCWIRVMQPWSGAAWGFQFIPRVGMEVLVTFVGGDIDRPMILGCVPNAEHPVPFRLPREKTKSGIRTNSTKGGNGYNELSFEDRKSGEKIFLRAQKDLEVAVGDAHRESIASSQTIRVGTTQTMHVGGAQYTAVAENRVDMVGGERVDSVAGNFKMTIGGDTGSAITGSSKRSISGNALDAVHGAHNTYVDGNYMLRVRGMHEVLVGDENDEHGTRLDVWGDHRVVASKQIVVEGHESVTLRCGDSSLTLTDGEIVVASAVIRIIGTDKVVVEGAGAGLTIDGDAELIGEKAALHSAGASVELDSAATVKGAAVALKSGGGAEHADEEVETESRDTQRLALTLADENSDPYPNTRYELIVAGERFKGTTDGSGGIRQSVPNDAVTGTLTLWPDNGRRLEFHLAIGELPPTTSVLGALTRLRSMGYFAGEPRESLDDESRSALRYFQEDEGLEATGELDDATQSAIDSAAHS